MRVLTKYELEQFDIAFKHISSLSVMQNEFTELFMLRHGHDSQSAIPPCYFALSESVGGFGALKDKFCLLYKKEAVEWLIKYCFDNVIQPRDFEIIGSVRKIEVTRSYSHTEHLYEARQ